MNKLFFRGFIISALMISSAGYIKAQNLELIPYPSHIEILKGNCTLNYAQLYINNKELSGLLHFFNEEIGPRQNSQIPKQVIDLKIQPSLSLRRVMSA